jgi:subtilisin family serine protease
MAGLIAAHGHGTGNRRGALGIAPRAKILPIRTSYGRLGNPRKTVEAIELAVERGATVISFSSITGAFKALLKAVQEAIAQDVVVVAAVGNRPDDFAIGYPARYPGVLAVGATARNDKIAKVSVTGPEVTMTAPGADIRSTGVRNGYRTGTGTSDSTAIMAGAVALIRSEFPDETAPQVIQRLTATANDEGAPGRDNQYGYGTLNLKSALTATDIPAVESPAPKDSAAAPPLATAAPPVEASGPLFRFNTAFYVAIALVGLMVVVGGGVLILLYTRRRRP